MKIALLPGDGIGPEIVGEATKVLDELRREGLSIETETAPIGGAGYDAAGRPLPEATLALARTADAVLLGAVSVSIGSPSRRSASRTFVASPTISGPIPSPGRSAIFIDIVRRRARGKRTPLRVKWPGSRRA